MAIVIGPRFAADLEAAGLGALPMSWSADGRLDYGPVVTDAQKAQVAAVLATHDPTAPAPKTLRQQQVEAAKARIADLVADGSVPARIRAFAAALDRVLDR